MPRQNRSIPVALTAPEILEHFCTDLPGVHLAILVSVDGFALASAGTLANNPEQLERFAAIASSLGALADAAGKEMSAANYENLLINYHEHRLIVRPINAKSETPYLFAAVTDRSLLLQKLSAALKSHCKALAKCDG